MSLTVKFANVYVLEAKVRRISGLRLLYVSFTIRSVGIYRALCLRSLLSLLGPSTCTPGNFEVIVVCNFLRLCFDFSSANSRTKSCLSVRAPQRPDAGAGAVHPGGGGQETGEHATSTTAGQPPSAAGQGVRAHRRPGHLRTQVGPAGGGAVGTVGADRLPGHLRTQVGPTGGGAVGTVGADRRPGHLRTQVGPTGGGAVGTVGADRRPGHLRTQVGPAGGRGRRCGTANPVGFQLTPIPSQNGDSDAEPDNSETISTPTLTPGSTPTFASLIAFVA